MSTMEDLQHDLAAEDSACKVLQHEDGNGKQKIDRGSIADVEGNLVANCAGLHVDEEEADQVDRLGEIHCCWCRIRRRAFGTKMMAGHKSVQIVDTQPPLCQATAKTRMQTMYGSSSELKMEMAPCKPTNCGHHRGSSGFQPFDFGNKHFSATPLLP